MSRRWVPLLLVVVSVVAGCSEDEAVAVRPAITGPATQDQAQSLPTTTMTFGGRELTLEIADEPDEQATGLMHRRSMPRDHGMIFVWDEPAFTGFYMKNTHIPLDIVFVLPDGRIDSIRQMTPLDERTLHRPDRPVKWAIELNRGVPAQLGMRPGVRLPIPPEAGGP